MTRALLTTFALCASVALAEPAVRKPLNWDLSPRPTPAVTAAPGTLELRESFPELYRFEVAGNGFIEVAHAMVLEPSAEHTQAHMLGLAQQAVRAGFAAQPTLEEVDVSVYRREGFQGLMGPLPLLTASVPRARMAEFLALTPGNFLRFDRLWLNRMPLSAPERQPSPALEQHLAFAKDRLANEAPDLSNARVRELSALFVDADPHDADGDTSSVLFRGGSHRPIAALTFDDAPHPLYAPLILDTLARAQVRATFFCIGRNAVAYPYFVRDMARAGHEIANHTYNHVRLPLLRPEEVRDEVDKATRALERLSGQKVRYFRPPGGEYTLETLALTRDAGLVTAFWTSDPGDFANPGVSVLTARLARNLRPGAIVLLHDNAPETVEALGAFLNVAKLLKIRLGTVGELSTNPILKGDNRAWQPPFRASAPKEMGLKSFTPASGPLRPTSSVPLQTLPFPTHRPLSSPFKLNFKIHLEPLPLP